MMFELHISDWLSFLYITSAKHDPQCEYFDIIEHTLCEDNHFVLSTVVLDNISL